MTLTPQTSLGERYLLQRRLAFGGMGEVWEGTDVVLDRPVAVKILRAELADDDAFRRRFRAEARTAGRVPHPGIAAVFDYGETVVGDKGIAYLVMELVPGEALSTILAREGGLTTDRTLDVVAQAARALHAAHERGVVHRDVKPANLMVTPDGRVKVTDFGIARPDDHEPLTATGQVMGTAHYLAPELARGRAATPASDIYALGVVMYECLAGRRPFEGDDQIGVATAHLSEEPPPLPATLSPDVRALVGAAMQKDPARRLPTAEAFASAAEGLRLRGQPGAAPGYATAPTAYALGPPLAGAPVVPGAAVSGALLAGGGAYPADARGSDSAGGFGTGGYDTNAYGAHGYAAPHGGAGYDGNGTGAGAYGTAGFAPGYGTPAGGTGPNGVAGPPSGATRYGHPGTAPLPVGVGPGTGGVRGRGKRRVSLPLLALLGVVLALVVGTAVMALTSHDNTGASSRGTTPGTTPKPGVSAATSAPEVTHTSPRDSATTTRAATGGGAPVVVAPSTHRPSASPSASPPAPSRSARPSAKPSASPTRTPSPTTTTPTSPATTPQVSPTTTDASPSTSPPPAGG